MPENTGNTNQVYSLKRQCINPKDKKGQGQKRKPRGAVRWLRAVCDRLISVLLPKGGQEEEEELFGVGLWDFISCLLQGQLFVVFCPVLRPGAENLPEE